MLYRQTVTEGMVEGVIAVAVARNAAENGRDLPRRAAADPLDGLQQQVPRGVASDIKGVAARCTVQAEDVAGLVKEDGLGLGSSAVNGNEVIQ